MPRRSGPLRMAGGWDATSGYGELLSLVDGLNDYGVVPDFSAESWPCRDALAIFRAVEALDGCVLELPADWRPAPELGALGGLGAKAVSDALRRLMLDDGAGGLSLRIKPAALVITRAVMGWDGAGLDIGDVVQRYEAHANGRERWFVRRAMDTEEGLVSVETDGWSARTRRPLPGAYRKPYLDPDPVAAIVARAEHQIWLSALAIVAEDVAGVLEDVEMLPSKVPAEPWSDGARPSIVLPDLAAEAALAEGERQRRRALFAERFPRWFRRLENKNPCSA